MFYYENDNKLYTSIIPLNDADFNEILEEEYEERKSAAIGDRDKGTLSENFDEDWTEFTSDDATEEDYIRALESLGVNFNG